MKDNSLTDYKGQTIGFCNPCCRDDFAKQPENYPQVLAQYFPEGRSHFYDGNVFSAEKEWGSQHIANLDGFSVKIHATSTPYHWHTNDEQEIFVVLNGTVDMHYKDKKDAEPKIQRLESGMIAHMEKGAQHVAHPIGLARILVIERLGSE